MRSEYTDKLRVDNVKDGAPGGGVSVIAIRSSNRFTGHVEEITFSSSKKGQPMVGDFVFVTINWDNSVPEDTADGD